jgi:hypothetical protein
MSVGVVEATGSWRAIGRAYGEELRNGIQRPVAFYDDSVPMLGGTTADLHPQLGPYIEAARPSS